MKKSISLILAVVLVLGLLAGCGSTTPATEAPAPETTAAPETTVAPETTLPLLKEFDNLLIVRTFSKSHALAGMRVGYALGSRELIDYLRRIRDSFNSYPLDVIAQHAAAASILDTAYTDATVGLVKEARDKCYAALTKAGVRVLPSATNFLFVKADHKDATVVQHRLREEGILVRHFSSGRLAPWLRVTVGNTQDMETVTKALLRLCRPDTEEN